MRRQLLLLSLCLTTVLFGAPLAAQSPPAQSGGITWSGNQARCLWWNSTELRELDTPTMQATPVTVGGAPLAGVQGAVYPTAGNRALLWTGAETYYHDSGQPAAVAIADGIPAPLAGVRGASVQGNDALLWNNTKTWRFDLGALGAASEVTAGGASIADAHGALVVNSGPMQALIWNPQHLYWFALPGGTTEILAGGTPIQGVRGVVQTDVLLVWTDQAVFAIDPNLPVLPPVSLNVPTGPNNQVRAIAASFQNAVIWTDNQVFRYLAGVLQAFPVTTAGAQIADVRGATFDPLGQIALLWNPQGLYRLVAGAPTATAVQWNGAPVANVRGAVFPDFTLGIQAVVYSDAQLYHFQEGPPTLTPILAGGAPLAGVRGAVTFTVNSPALLWTATSVHTFNWLPGAPAMPMPLPAAPGGEIQGAVPGPGTLAMVLTPGRTYLYPSAAGPLADFPNGGSPLVSFAPALTGNVQVTIHFSRVSGTGQVGAPASTRVTAVGQSLGAPHSPGGVPPAAHATILAATTYGEGAMLLGPAPVAGAVAGHGLRWFGSSGGLAPADVTGGTTQRLSVGSLGVQGNDASFGGAPSADGRYVAFASLATNLVPNDVNSTADVFVFDRQLGAVTRVSIASNGAEGNSHSREPTISSNGRYVAFTSQATNLVVNDTNGLLDCFVHDRLTGQTVRVTVATGGAQANGKSERPRISADGLHVVFLSSATNLVAGDVNGRDDIFVRDLATGATSLVSIATGGAQANNDSLSASVSADGQRIAFTTSAGNLVPGDTNSAVDVFVRDRQTGQTARVSVATGGAQATGNSEAPAISADGQYVAFGSHAANLVAGDTNAWPDVFVHHLATATTERVSVASNGMQANGASATPATSADGRYVAFYSLATNLAPLDTNGVADAFVHDRLLGNTRRVHLDAAGMQANAASVVLSPGALSADGHHLAFTSGASNLVPMDTNGKTDAFVRDLYPKITTSDPTPSIGSVTVLQLESPGDAGLVYFAGCAFDYTPGIPLVNSWTVPLNFDPLLQISLGSPSVFQNFLGTLDAQGMAQAQIVLPNNPLLVGMPMAAAFAILDPSQPSQVAGISNAALMTVVP